MRAVPSRMLSATILTLALGWGVTGCATEENGGPSGAGAAVIGNWNATTFVAMGTDYIAAGMGLLFTFDNTGGYTFSITNDQADLCDGNVGDNCSDMGDYDANGSAITLDPGTVDEAVLNYTINGNIMAVTATIDGTAIVATFDRQ